MSKKWWILIILAIILWGCGAFILFRQEVWVTEVQELSGDNKEVDEKWEVQYTELDECKIKQNKCYELQKQWEDIICLLCPSDLDLNENWDLEVEDGRTGTIQEILRENELKMAVDHPLLPPEECPEGEDWFCIPNTCMTLDIWECWFTCWCAVDNFNR